jgi:hypothetical protein
MSLLGKSWELPLAFTKRQNLTVRGKCGSPFGPDGTGPDREREFCWSRPGRGYHYASVAPDPSNDWDRALVLERLNQSGGKFPQSFFYLNKLDIGKSHYVK